MIKEIDGRWKCTHCGREWSAMLGDNEIPERCDCEEEEFEEITPTTYSTLYLG